MTLYLPFISMYNKKYKSGPGKKRNGPVPGKTGSPLVVFSRSLLFWLNSHLERGGSPSLLILPGLLRSERCGGGSPLLRETGKTPVAYVIGANPLSQGFIGSPCKPSSSASFLH